jgi:hypothetical protein
VGELVVLENGDLRGEAANRCARICSLTPAGEVYLSSTAASLLNHHEAELTVVTTEPLKGIDEPVTIYRVVRLANAYTDHRNPFIWRTGITSAEDFFNRANEQRILQTYIQGHQSCQIIGQRRIGKTSLLRLLERIVSTWVEKGTPAYLDLQDPRCFTLSGWLALTAKRWKWEFKPTTLAEFSEGVDVMMLEGPVPILCLDEFDELSSRRGEFSRDYYAMLRSCVQRTGSFSVVTASRKPLSELTDAGDPASPFYNALPLVRLECFEEADSQDFVNLFRPGTPSFSPYERRMILSFAKGHPMALQVACFHVVEAKRRGESVKGSLNKAADDMKEHLPCGW